MTPRCPRIHGASDGGSGAVATGPSAWSSADPSRSAADETVDKAVAIGGSVTVAGHVRYDAVAIGGSVTILPGASVGGDSVAIGGAVSVAEGATLEGDNVSLGGAIPTTVGSMTRWVVGGPHMFSMFRFASRLTRAVAPAGHRGGSSR